MKNLLNLLLVCFISLNVLAQVPQKMSYQAIIHDANNNLIKNQQVKIRISILKGSTTGSVSYSETQSINANTNGLVTLEIGMGTVVSGSFASIDWSSGSYYVKTEIDPSGGTNYTINGASQLLSVPYALYSDKANTSATTTTNVIKSGTGNQIVVYTSNTAYCFYYISGTGLWSSISLSGTPIGAIASDGNIVIYTSTNAYGVDLGGNWKSQSLSGTPIGIVSTGESQKIVVYTSSNAYCYYNTTGTGNWTSQSLSGSPLGASSSLYGIVVYTTTNAYGVDGIGNWKSQSLSGTPAGIISK